MATAARQRSRRRLLELAGICLAAAAVGWWVFPVFSALRNAERTAQDGIIAFSGRHDVLRDFVFVAIDDPSMKLDQLWPEDFENSPELRMMQAGWPWPRPVYAAALDKLLTAGARLVIFDLILGAEKPGDDVLRAALDRHRDKVVLGANITTDAVNPSHPGMGAISLTMPAASLIDAPEGDPRIGFVNFKPEEDLRIRSARFTTTLNGQSILSLSGAAARQMHPGFPLPEDRVLNFRFADLSAVDVVPFFSLFVAADWQRTLRDGAIFRDKIVMVGPSAAILQDNHAVAGGHEMPGPLIHVSALAALLTDNFYERSGRFVNGLMVFLAAAGALGIGARIGRRPMLALAAVLAGFAAMVVGSYLLAHWADYLLPVVQPGFTLALAGVTCIAWNFARERQESGRMRSTLERYVSRNVVREILDHRDDFLSALGGTRRPMTVFFSDVRGFTTFSERADATQVVEQLNEYLGAMVEIIFRHQGTVDKFMGDGIMAVWGNVVSEGPATDAARAVRAAVEMLERLEALNAGWQQRGLPPFHIGIGLHHGDAVFGNIGSAEKMEPTVIGDTVNLASRVEGLTKKYGVPLCLTRPVADLLAGDFRFRSVDLVQVMGKSRPVEILTVVSPPDAPLPAWLEPYERGIAEYRALRFDAAAAAFTGALALAPDDRLSRLYLERSEAFLQTAPPPEWDGTEIAKSK